VAGLSSLGIGSNMDVESIVTKLMSVEKQPLTRMVKQETSYQMKLTGFGTLKGALAQFQSAVRGLADGTKFTGVKSSVIDTSVATVTATNAAAPSNYALEVSQLAKAQKLVVAGTGSDTVPLGKGVIKFDLGTILGPLGADGKAGPATLGADGKYTDVTGFQAGPGTTKSVTIAEGSSLADIRDAINKAGIGVTAAIVNDGSATPYRLTLTQTATGEASSMKITVEDADPLGSPLLSALLTHDPLDPAHAMKETSTALNAKFKIDGIDVSKPSNTVDDVLTGLTINLLKTNVGTTTALNVSRDTAAVSTAVTAFVKAYNDISQTLRDAMAYNPATKTGAILNGEASVRSIQTQVRTVLTAPIDGGGALTRLSQVGVTLQKDGTLALDSAKLNTALAANFDDFAGLFAAVPASGSGATAKPASNGYAAQFEKLATALLAPGGPLASRTEGISESIRNLTKREVEFNARMVTVEKRYRAQFTALDLTISKMNTTSSYMAQQLEQISNLSKQ
jgi:flagellar hook-associated protein 2